MRLYLEFSVPKRSSIQAVDIPERSQVFPFTCFDPFKRMKFIYLRVNKACRIGDVEITITVRSLNPFRLGNDRELARGSDRSSCFNGLFQWKSFPQSFGPFLLMLVEMNFR